MFTRIIDRFRSIDLQNRKKTVDATELSRLLLRKVREEGTVAMNWELAHSLGAGRKLLYRTAYQLVIRERLSMLSDPDEGVLLLTNTEFNRLLARRSGWEEAEIERHYGRQESPVGGVSLDQEKEEAVCPAESGDTVQVEPPAPPKVAAMLSDTEKLPLGGVLGEGTFAAEPLTALPEEALHTEHALEIVRPGEILHEELLLEEKSALSTVIHNYKAFLQRVAGRVFAKAKSGRNPEHGLHLDSDPSELDWFDLEIGAAGAGNNPPAAVWREGKGDIMPEGTGQERQSFPERGRERWDKKDFSGKNNPG